MSNNNSENMNEDLTQSPQDEPNSSDLWNDQVENNTDENTAVSTDEPVGVQETSPTQETSVRLGTTDAQEESPSDPGIASNVDHESPENVVDEMEDGENHESTEDASDQNDQHNPSGTATSDEELNTLDSTESDENELPETDTHETSSDDDSPLAATSSVVDHEPNTHDDTNEIPTVDDESHDLKSDPVDSSLVEEDLANVENTEENLDEGAERVDGDALVNDYLTDDRLQPEDYVQQYEESSASVDVESHESDTAEISSNDALDESAELETHEVDSADHDDKHSITNDYAHDGNYSSEDSNEYRESTPLAATHSRSDKYDMPEKRRGGFGKGLVVGGLCIGLVGLAGGYFMGGDSVRGPKVAAAPMTMEPTACERFENQGFECEIAWEPDDDTDAEELIRQSVDEGDRATKGSSITLFYSSGPSESEMPRVKGLSIREAQEKLQAKGIKTEEIQKIPNSGLSVDTVVKSDVDEGETVKNGDSVVLEVSNGEIRAEDWVGTKWRSAKKSAEKRGFTVEINKVRNGAPYGLVYRQSLAPNEQPDDDNTIELTVSEPAQEESRLIPNVIGQSQEDAQDALTQEGFENINTVTVASNEESGTVITTNPSNGNEATSLDEITLVVSE